MKGSIGQSRHYPAINFLALNLSGVISGMATSSLPSSYIGPVDFFGRGKPQSCGFFAALIDL